MRAIFYPILCLFLLAVAMPALAQEEPPPEEGLLQQPVGPPFSSPVDPDLYIIRPGDELQITFIQSELEPLTLQVDPEGRIVDKTIGVYDVSFKTLSQARTILEDAMNSFYNVSGIAIGITKPRQVSISVRGAVMVPGTYSIFTSQRVSEVIELAGGIRWDGSRRWIALTGGPNRLKVDLDRSIFLSDLDSDPYVYAGQIIRVPNKSKNLVQVGGEVNNPREVELVPGDDLRTLLRLAGGLRRRGDTTNLRIFNWEGEVSRDNIKGGDIILVPAREYNPEANPIMVFGAVKNQGLYDFRSGMTAGDAIEMAGGMMSDANASHTTVFRRPRVDEHGRITSIRYPIGDMTGNGHNFASVELHPEDSVFVPVKVGFVSVMGEVRYSGYFPYHPGKDALFYIQSAGGFLPTANKKQISVFNPVSTVTSMQSPGVVVGDGAVLTIDIREELK